jgi:septum formation inhibitor MinC
VGVRQQVIDLTKDMSKQTLIAAAWVQRGAGIDIEALQELTKALDDAGNAASSAFTGATDIIATFDQTSATEDLTKATGARSDAERSLHQLLARQAADKKRTVSDDQALARARQSVADATRDVSKTQGQVQASSLAGTYRRNIGEAQTFVDDIQQVTRRGLDPQFVARLLEQGPEKANPILEQLVGDHSRRMIQLANRSEETLREINTKVVEFTRLTTLATKSSTDRLATYLGRAMTIASRNLASGGRATARSLARSLRIPENEVRRIADEFGITLQGELDRQKPTVRINIHNPSLAGLQAALDAGLPGPGVMRRADGGRLEGPFIGPRADNVLYRGTPGEFVVQHAAASYYGYGFLDAVNRRAVSREALFGKVPRFADGGRIPASSPAAVTVVRVPVTETTEHHSPINVEHMHVTDVADLRRQEALERLRAGQRSGRRQP